MTLLIISPDYASHLFPLATLGTAWLEAGERVVVASGPATADIVAAFGFERVNLQLGRGSNPGTIRAEDQPSGEDDALRGFFDATRLGMVETLTFQAEARSSDLLWNPVEVARAVQQVVAEVQPDFVIVDHLAFSARLALISAGVRHADVVLGHPSALPVGDEVYGYPPEWPIAFAPAEEDLAALMSICQNVRDSFTAQWNAALRVLDPAAPPSTDAFMESGDILLLNYPAELHDAARGELLPRHAFLGSAVRDEAADADVDRWLAVNSDRPVVYVSFGSFLSVRGDVLGRVAEALRGLDVRVAIATGATDPAELGPIPDSWLVRGFLPQVTVLQGSALAVSHGGNNSVTEAMTHGVPLLLLPFSTDQFAGAAAVESAGFGLSLAPNTATVDELREAMAGLLALDGEVRRSLDLLGASLQGGAGPKRAYAALLAEPVEL
ncbi:MULTISPECIES: glycosyltransferase [Cryobacterium]|uniref:Glycosyltransferase n=1 Tax=Cryobacterium breve TaxID=1259258 RepID=A0ABY2J160_9MICO|nr:MULTISPECIES: glycosyltransferase [Cryobacterium]TFC93883.1 glycosyltransferase [Cryobacterium sp. TmT3-12]TFC97621.1 glycosyltransferase [Cryobacterium breve]